MQINQYPGACHICGNLVLSGEGYRNRHPQTKRGEWWLYHKKCYGQTEEEKHTARDKHQ